MNKELIKKYFNEFSHYIHGGEILVSDNGNIWEIPDYNVWTDTIVPYYKIVINDEYVELRKALAEGKTLQWTDGPDYWIDINHINIFIPLGKYRIKPEEPQFKINDWVTFKDETKHQITNVSLLSYTFDNNFSCGFKTPTVRGMKLWKPQPGEWCWFYNFNGLSVTVGKFIQMTNDKYIADAPSDKGTLSTQVFKHCQPFIGTLPTHLQ